MDKEWTRIIFQQDEEDQWSYLDVTVLSRTQQSTIKLTNFTDVYDIIMQVITNNLHLFIKQ